MFLKKQLRPIETRWKTLKNKIDKQDSNIGPALVNCTPGGCLLVAGYLKDSRDLQAGHQAHLKLDRSRVGWDEKI